ncbi:unnamed protein product, partial [marine sediment metagenome]
TEGYMHATPGFHLDNQFIGDEIIEGFFNPLWQHHSRDDAIPHVVFFPDWVIREKFALA